MRHPQLPGDVTRPNTVVSQLHYSLPYNVRQRPAVHKNATQLVHTTMALNKKTVISLTVCQTSRHDAIFEGITRNDNIHTTVELVRNLVAQGDAREGKWKGKGNWRIEWVASTLTPPPNVVYPALLKLMRTPRLPAVDWTDAPTDLNWFVPFGERRNLVSARVASRSARAIHTQVWNIAWWKRNMFLSTEAIIRETFAV